MTKMQHTDYKQELDLIIQLAERAGDIMLRYYDAGQQEQTKGDGTPVTIADTTINSMVITAIKEHFPEDEIVGEEESTAAYGMGRRWICDPIDGTAAYIAGLPSAMFSLCLTIDGKPAVACAYEPLRKLLFTAVRGQGSFCNDLRLSVSKATFDEGLIALAPDYVRPDLITEPFMQRLLAYDKQLSVFPGAVYRSCMVASGRIAGFPHPRVKPYDIAAVHLIVEEAGGRVTDVKGQPLDYSKDFRGAIISNGVSHDKLLELFKT